MWRSLIIGIAGGFVGNGVLGALFSASIVQKILYNPEWQSDLFIRVTTARDIPISVAGLVFTQCDTWLVIFAFASSIPGKNWWQKGLFWGLSIWLLFWVFQEWFVYHTLLQEPLLLNLFELSLLLMGSLVEGLVIAGLSRVWLMREH